MILSPMKIRNHLLLLITVVACNTIGISHAEERIYNIELLIFTQSNTENFNTETWPDTWRIPQTLESIQPNSKAAEDLMRRLTADELTLNGIADNLEKSSRYHLLAYRGWQQQGLNKDEAFDVRIRVGKRYAASNTLLDESSNLLLSADGTALNNAVAREENAKSTNSETTKPARLNWGYEDPALADNPEALIEKYGSLFYQTTNDDGIVSNAVIREYQRLDDGITLSDDDIYQIDGNVKIVLSRFLHIYTDLLLMEPVKLQAIPDTDNSYKIALANKQSDFTTLHGFNIKDHRRMRSNEIHFLDHPLLGIIVKVSPFKLEEESS